jgi:dienelactone hydrolase
MVWIAKHGPEVTRPTLDAVIAALKAEGVTTFDATGYCFGGKYALDLAIENVTKAIAISHPSLLQIPADFEVRFHPPYTRTK